MHNTNEQSDSFSEFLKQDDATRYTGVAGVANLYEEKEMRGLATISRFTFKSSENLFYNLRVMRDAGSIFRIYDGEYCRLHVGSVLMMSDTPMERYSNRDFIRNAKGRVLIAGLGIGLIVKAILDKPDVEEVWVIEKYQDVIDLVAPRFAHPKLKVTQGDIFMYQIPKEEKFDTIYFDIWPQISTDNLEEIRKLHTMYRRNKRSKESYMDSWMANYLRKRRAKERREQWW